MFMLGVVLVFNIKKLRNHELLHYKKVGKDSPDSDRNFDNFSSILGILRDIHFPFYLSVLICFNT